MRFRFLVFLLFLLFPIKISAQELVVINEICWMGNASSSADEWIELYNPKKENVSLEGWGLKSERGKIKINLKGEIKSEDFFLLERTDDSSVPYVEADLIYKGALSNQGEKLVLENEKGEIVDLVDCLSGWFAGSNKSKKTMSRVSPFVSGREVSNWQNSLNPGGTPKAANDFKIKNEKPEEIKIELAGSEGEIKDRTKILFKSLVILGLILTFLVILQKKYETH